jgi:predicted transcriptional regulator
LTNRKAKTPVKAHKKRRVTTNLCAVARFYFALTAKEDYAMPEMKIGNGNEHTNPDTAKAKEIALELKEAREGIVAAKDETHKLTEMYIAEHSKVVNAMGDCARIKEEMEKYKQEVLMLKAKIYDLLEERGAVFYD